MTKEDARKMVQEYPAATLAGWLLTCDAPVNLTKGQNMIDGMGFDDSNIAIIYRDYCLKFQQVAHKQHIDAFPPHMG